VWSCGVVDEGVSLGIGEDSVARFACFLLFLRCWGSFSAEREKYGD